MSSINNVITTTFRATGGNVVSQLRSYAAGFGTLGGQINDVTNMSGRLNNQWRAIGTTIRYAVAGTALYGITNMISKVAQLNTQLGQMQAISGIGIGSGASAITNNQVPALLNNLMNTSVQTITPLTDVNDAAINFLSTVQNVKPSQLPDMLTQIGIGAKIAQTPVEDLTQAATTMQIAFGRAVNPQSIGQFSRMWQQLIGTAPGGVAASSTIAQAMPGLASMFQLAPGRSVPGNLGQAQMMALTLGVLRTGMPAATGMRGLTYLLQSVAQPTGGAAKALAGVGITPQLVQQQGIFAAVMKLLQQIRPVGRGEVRRLGAIPDDTLDQLDTSGGSLPGISAQEMVRLRQMIPRIHGIRAAIILSSQLQQQGDVSSIQQDLQTMLDAQDQNSKEAKQLSRAWSQFRQRARLQEAANAINTMGLQVAQTFEPIMGFAAQHIIDPVAGAARRHPKATRDITLGAGAFLAAMGIGRFLGVGRIPGIGRIPGLGKLLGGSAGSAFIAEKSITAAMSGATGLGATPTNPLYVIVVGQLFGGGTPGPTSGGGLLKDVENTAKGALGLKMLSKLKGAGGLLKGASAEDWLLFGRLLGPLALGYEIHKHGARQVLNPFASLGGDITPTREMELRGKGKHVMEYPEILRRTQQLFGANVADVFSANKALWKGQADINLVIDQRDPQTGKLTRRRVHVPVDLWAGGRHPTHRGKTTKNVRAK